MKTLAATFGILVLAAVLVVPVFAHRQGWDDMEGSGYCWNDSWWAEDIPQGQRAKVDKLERKFFKDTSKLRTQIWAKSNELDVLMCSSNPDPQEVRKLQNDIGDLKRTLDEKRNDFELKARKMIPDRGAFTRSYCGRRGMGIRGHYGHRGGYGPGTCWR
ncbi:MAG: periplasmic heavy metal sensor [Deltaproteobacteria bacterium]|nr:periplasmic heavy metal sensor [Deltaproteobacteria bacterium]